MSELGGVNYDEETNSFSVKYLGNNGPIPTGKEIYKPMDFYLADPKEHGVGITADGHTMMFADIVKDLNKHRRGFIQRHEEVMELRAENDELKAEKKQLIEMKDEYRKFLEKKDGGE